MVNGPGRWRSPRVWAWSTPERSAGSGAEAAAQRAPAEGLDSRAPLAATPVSRCPGLPIGDHLGMGALGLFGDRHLVCADALRRTRAAARGLDGDPGGPDEHCARPLLRDPPMRGGLIARLLDPRVQTEVAHQLAWASRTWRRRRRRRRSIAPRSRRRRGSSSAAWFPRS
jgi:hypothetical protein